MPTSATLPLPFLFVWMICRVPGADPDVERGARSGQGRDPLIHTGRVETDPFRISDSRVSAGGARAGERGFQILGQRRAQLQAAALHRVLEGEARGVQELAVESEQPGMSV